MQRALQLFGIAVFLLLGASFIVTSLQFRDGRWAPAGWPVGAAIFFGLALLMASRRPQKRD